MSETVKMKLERGRTENAINAVVGIASTVLLYYSLHPDVASRHSDAIREWWQGVLHRASVAQTFTAIRSLPETPDQA